MSDEKDPHGIEQHEPGAKLDEGKTRVGLVLGGFPNALEQVSRVGTFGANKYTEFGWLKVPDGQSRYTDAMLRHFLAECKGELIDRDSGMFHAAQTAWNALARLELMIRDMKGTTDHERIKKTVQPSDSENTG